MKRLLLILLVPIIGFGQTHFIDQNNMQMFGDDDVSDISINTYYNSLDSCSISWDIITNSLPSLWNFSICFPNCYPIGVISGQDETSANQQLYLNCHMYPNGQAGEGIIQMEIVTNNLHKDTVTWLGTINSTTGLFQINSIDVNKRLIKVTDLLGRETKVTNSPLFYIYDDGIVEKRIVIE
jgi:hypothetical protein